MLLFPVASLRLRKLLSQLKCLLHPSRLFLLYAHLDFKGQHFQHLRAFFVIKEIRILRVSAHRLQLGDHLLELRKLPGIEVQFAKTETSFKPQAFILALEIRQDQLIHFLGFTRFT
jgi:hypothetical protein